MKALSELLRENGFSKRGRTWNRSSGGITHVVDLQQSSFSDRSCIDVTLNIGLWIRSVWTVCLAKEAPGFVSEVDCFPRFRIGELLARFQSNAKDIWWSVTEEIEAERLDAELRTISEDYCLPFFAQFNSLQDVKQFCDSAPLRLMPMEKLNYAVLCYLSGDHTRYKQLVQDFEDPRLYAWQPRVEAIRRSLQEIK